MCVVAMLLLKCFEWLLACYYLVVSVLIGKCKVVASVLWMVAQKSTKIPVPNYGSGPSV